MQCRIMDAALHGWVLVYMLACQHSWNLLLVAAGPLGHAETLALYTQG